MLGHSAKPQGLIARLPANKLSDFSIEHILHRAGEDKRRTHPYYGSSSAVQGLCDNPKNFIMHESPSTANSTSVALNWLQYSRYHPPKLQRQTRTGPAKRTPGRLPRVPFTPEQLATLEEAYRRSTYLSSEDANKLADRLDLSNVRVKIWFQNRRARERREKRDVQMCGGYSIEDNETLDVETVDDSDNSLSSVMSD